MFRVLLAGAFVAGLMVAGSYAEDKKAEPAKKKERIAINEPNDVAKDADFGLQGEYSGSPEYKVGVQVVAKGQGEFDLKIFQGGLPGEGWDGKPTTKATAKRNDDGSATITGKDLTGKIFAKTLSIVSEGKESALTKVERKSTTLGKPAPDGAVVLFGKEGDEKNWEGGKIVTLSDGKFLGMGVVSKEKFQGFTAHIEFRLPWMPNSTGQGRGNSGVYLQNRYECQVLDSFGLNGENNECGGIYTQHKPSVNMCYPPMSWQTYDIEFTPAEFAEDGKKTKNGRATIYHNGVKIHDNIEFPKDCPGGQPEKPTAGPFQFQNHGDPVVYRNVWVVPAK